MNGCGALNHGRSFGGRFNRHEQQHDRGREEIPKQCDRDELEDTQLERPFAEKVRFLQCLK